MWKKFGTCLVLVIFGYFIYLEFSGDAEDSNDIVSAGKTVIEHKVNRIASKKVVASTGTVASAKTVRTFPAYKIRFRSKHIQPLDEGPSELEQCENWGVLTTIFEPSEAVRRMLYLTDWCLVIVGDKDKPMSYKLSTSFKTRMYFLNKTDQLLMDSRFVEELPWNSFGRKNIGYVYAMAHGARIIWDFDDDNTLKFWLNGAAPDPDLWIGTFVPQQNVNTLRVTEVTAVDSEIFFNPYPFLGAPSSKAWPRGFPLNRILKIHRNRWAFENKDMPFDEIGTLQSLADFQPDVDAIYRLTEGTPFYFNSSDISVMTDDSKVLLLSNKLYTPTNAQATIYFYKAFFTMYLPVTVSGRVSDIWRSYIGQTILSLYNIKTGFLRRPIVDQERNPHDYEADFSAERQLYTQTYSFVHYLNTWKQEQISTNSCQKRSVEDLMEELYIQIYERGFIEINDVFHMQKWLEALAENRAIKSTNGEPRLSKFSTKYHLGQSVTFQSAGELNTTCEVKDLESRHFWLPYCHEKRDDTMSMLASIGQKVTLAADTTNINIDALIKPEDIKVYKGKIPEFLQTCKWDGITTAQIVSESKLFFKTSNTLRDINTIVSSSHTPAIYHWLALQNNKHLLLVHDHRFSLGVCTAGAWQRVSEQLVELELAGRAHTTASVTIAVTGRYEYEHLRYFTGINSIKIVHNYVDLKWSGLTYAPEVPEVLLVGDRSKLDKMIKNELKDKNALKVVYQDDRYKTYSAADIQKHPAVIYFPSKVTSQRFSELYATAVPIFVPSPLYLRQHYGLGPDRSPISKLYCNKGAHMWSLVPKHPSVAHAYNPSAEFEYSPEAEMYWLQFSDFYEDPHIQFFDDINDMASKLEQLDLNSIHEAMELETEVKNIDMSSKWCEIIQNS